jgi:hypothetical protein
MNDALAVVQIQSSGISETLDAPGAVLPKWPSPSMLISSVLASFNFELTSASRRETVFLTRAQQRIMDRALRRSFRIIA